MLQGVFSCEKKQQQGKDDYEVNRQARSDGDHVHSHSLKKIKAGCSHGIRDQAKDTDGRQSDDGVSQLHHGLETVIKQIYQKIMRLTLKLRNGKTENYGEEDEAEDIPFSGCFYRIGGDHSDENVSQ